MKVILSILFGVPMIAWAQSDSNIHFSHTITTTGSSAAVWSVWTDVEGWNKWDSGLKSASLDGDFVEGARGILVPDKGPKSRFVIVDVRDGQSYRMKTRIPLGWLVVERRLAVFDNETSFTHEVRFTGPLRGIFGASLGKRYRTILPEVMGSIRAIVESNSAQK